MPVILLCHLVRCDARSCLKPRPIWNSTDKTDEHTLQVPTRRKINVLQACIISFFVLCCNRTARTAVLKAFGFSLQSYNSRQLISQYSTPISQIYLSLRLTSTCVGTIGAPRDSMAVPETCGGRPVDAALGARLDSSSHHPPTPLPSPRPPSPP